MQLLERHPQMLTLGANPHVQPAQPPIDEHFHRRRRPTPPADRRAKFLPTTLPITSRSFDTDLIRAMSCYDTEGAPGMHPLATRNQITGKWKGKYIYLDYNAYQNMVRGDIRSLYEGTFGQEEQEWDLVEHVIHVRSDLVGTVSPSTVEDEAGLYPVRERGRAYKALVEQRGWEPCLDDDSTTSSSSDQPPPPKYPGWTQEILLTGTGRTAWGEARLEGRVRGWDGLMTIQVDFGIPASTGKWLFRVYLHAEAFLAGRYRDTFTPPDKLGKFVCVGCSAGR